MWAHQRIGIKFTKTDGRLQVHNQGLCLEKLVGHLQTCNCSVLAISLYGTRSLQTSLPLMSTVATPVPPLPPKHLLLQSCSTFNVPRSQTSPSAIGLDEKLWGLLAISRRSTDIADADQPDDLDCTARGRRRRRGRNLIKVNM